MKIFSDSQGVSVLKSVTNSEEAANILMRDMEESEKVIEANVLNEIIEHGVTTPKFRTYKEALSLAESEVSKMIDSDKDIDGAMKILQRTITKFLN